MTEVWEEVFEPAPVPGWLTAFDESPDDAVDRLLWGRFYFGHLHAAEPEDLLIDWARLLGEEGEFLQRLDVALSRWVDEFWGSHPARRRAGTLADAWSRLSEVVTCVEGLTGTAGALRERFREASSYLQPLSGSPSRDPWGRYLGALAVYQEDRSLSPFWWGLCDLPSGVPFYHARYAMAGLSHLPPGEGEEKGGFRRDVVRGVVKLGCAFDRLSHSKLLPEKQAEEEFLGVARLTLASFPFPELWRDELSTVLDRQPANVSKWLRDLLPGLSARPRTGRKESDKTSPAVPSFAEWKEKTRRIAEALGTDAASALGEALQLIASLRIHTEATGDSEPLVRALCQFSSRVARSRPQEAVAWAEEAILWEPWDAYSWNTLTKALLRNRRPEEALEVSWQAVERFPQDVVARNGLGEVLKASRRLDEAEQVYRETVERFPQDVVARTGLGEVLKASRRLDEAEQVYRETVERFPQDVVARTGLGEVLKASRRLDEAEQVYRETVERFPQDVVARNGLGEVLKASRRLDEAEQVYRETVERFPQDVVARNGLGEVLKASRRLDEAEQVYRETVERFPQDEYARTGLERVHRAQQGLEEQAGSEEAPEPEDTLDVETTIDVAYTGSSSEDPHPQLSEVREPSGRPYDTVTATREGFPSGSLVSEARLYRRWARRSEELPQGEDPARLRTGAEQRLDEVLGKRPHDPRALTEKSLLLIETHRFEEARELLDENLARLPAAPTLLLALARAEREQAADAERRLDPEAEQELVDPPHQLLALDRAFEPLARLQEGRAYLALTDGDQRRAGAARAFDQLRRWIQRSSSLAPLRGNQGKERDFEPWFGQEMLRYALAPVDVEEKVEPRHVDAIDEHLKKNARIVDVLEEDFGLRQTAL